MTVWYLISKVCIGVVEEAEIKLMRHLVNFPCLYVIIHMGTMVASGEKGSKLMIIEHLSSKVCILLLRKKLT